ncbi:MAG: response regulator [Patescibacteria group bacterium]
MNVLIIEDEKMLLMALEEEFKRKKCSVFTAEDGDQGWQILSKHPALDMIVLDLVLPKIDGFELLKNIKADDKLKTTPLVVLTNLSDENTIAAIVASGGTDYLVKADYTLQEVVGKIIEIAKRPAFEKYRKLQSPIT